MNMIHTESTPLLEGCYSFLADGGHLIWSGILADEKEIAVVAASDTGFRMLRETTEEEWWCGLFRI
jgi:ribosomal protein L11 methylase PrmA